MKLKDDDLLRLKNEIIMAEKLSDDKLRPVMRQALERYTSRHVPLIARDWDVVLNEVYPIIQYEIPSIYYRNPRVFLKPRNKNYFYKKRDPVTGQMQEVMGESAKSAKTQEAILNYTISEIHYKEEVQKTLMDALLFKHGVLWHGYKGSFGMTQEQSLYIQDEQVFVKRISPMQFLFDPAVTLGNLDEARWIARTFDVPLQDIQEDDTLDVDPQIKGDLGFGLFLDSDKKSPIDNGGQDTRNTNSRTKTLLDYTDEQYRKLTGSRFIKVYEIFMRPSNKEKREGKKGKIILYTAAQKKPLRVNDWPYKVDAWPAKILMFNEVPDSIFGVSDIEIWGSIADQKNVIINLQLRNAQENSKALVFFDKDGMDEADVQKIERGEQGIVGIKGSTANKVSFTNPGNAVSQELYVIDQRIQNNLDEKSGVADLKKGVLRSGEESATSVQIRNSGASMRPAYRQDKMADFLKDSCLFLNHLLKQFMPTEDAVRITGSFDIEWCDKPTKEEIQADVDVEIDMISAQPENPDKEIQELNTILNMMIQALTVPPVGQKIAQEQMIFNISPVIEQLLTRLKIKDPDVFRKLRPEESQGYAPVAELKAAQLNTEAALLGKQPPSPPAPGQDHATRLEIYNAIKKIFKAEGRVSPILEQLIMTQAALAKQESDKQSPKAGTPLKAGRLSPSHTQSPSPVGAK